MRIYKIVLIFFLSVFTLFAAQKETPYVEGEVIVKFTSPDIKPEYHPKVRSLNLRSVRKYNSFPSIHQFKIPSGLDTKKVIEELSSDPDVLYAEPNYIYSALLEPNDEYYPSQWGLPKINAPSAWEKTTGSSEVIIAVIDTGVKYDHPDLSDNIWTDSESNPGYNAIKNNADPMDDHSHGTHCSGIIGAVGNNNTGVCGVNWNVKIMALKFLDASGNGTLADAIECIDYVIRRKDEGENVVAISNSWGGYTYSSALYEAIARLAEKGVLFIAAAGNSSRDNDITPLYPASYNLPNVISVASSDVNDNRSYFSNYGRTRVHIAAPGSSIYSTIPSGYGYKSGTSMATPFVAGVAGLISSYTGKKDAIELKDIIIKGITRLPQWTNLTITGGRLNADESLRVATLPDYVLPVKNFSAEKVSGGVYLTWEFPSGANYVIIRRGDETFPSHWEEGTPVYTGTGNSFTDEEIEEGKAYYYTIWAYYGSLQQIEEDKISPAGYTYTNSPPLRPECMSPSDGAENISLTPLLRATGFVDPDNDLHNASQWQIARNSNFSTVVWNSTTSPVTEITVPSRTLSYNTKYYWRVRYKDEKENWSEWAVPYTFTTEEGSSGGGGGGGGCFIATAVFGSPYERHVQIFREFRDRKLLKTKQGRVFVRWYYRHSPKYADIIRKRPFLKFIARVFLVPLSYILHFFVK
ncbi:MAG: S8 family serine peptidase [bacterium]|nr:S8 family serine peptidase [bacterium]